MKVIFDDDFVFDFVVVAVHNRSSYHIYVMSHETLLENTYLRHI